MILKGTKFVLQVGWLGLALIVLGGVSHALPGSEPGWVILLDQSASIPASVYEQFITIVKTLGEQEPTAILLFGENVQEIKAFHDTLDTSAIPAVPKHQFTLLYDAVLRATQMIRSAGFSTGGVLVLSDGVDDGSVLLFDDLRETLLQANVRVYAIGIPERVKGYRTLSRMALMSSGHVMSIHETQTTSLLNQFEAWNRSLLESIPEAPPSPSPAGTPIAPKATTPSAPSRASESPVSEKPATPVPVTRKAIPHPIVWIIAGVLVAGIGLAITLLILRSREQNVRRCEHCGRVLERFEFECMVCRSEELTPESSVPIEPIWFEKEPLDEALARTVVLEQQPTLVVRSGAMAGAVFPLPIDRPVTIGRSGRCDITINDPAISGQHCRLVPREQKWFLVDLKSTNGTFLNDQRVEVQVIQPGDRLRIGNHELVFRYEPVEGGTGAHPQGIAR